MSIGRGNSWKDRDYSQNRDKAMWGSRVFWQASVLMSLDKKLSPLAAYRLACEEVFRQDTPLLEASNG